MKRVSSLEYVDCPIVHQNHGGTNWGFYCSRHIATDYFSKPISKLCSVGKNGLLEWTNVKCIEKNYAV